MGYKPSFIDELQFKGGGMVSFIYMPIDKELYVAGNEMKLDDMIFTVKAVEFNSELTATLNGAEVVDTVYMWIEPKLCSTK